MLKFSGFDLCTAVIKQNVLVLSKYTLKYFGTKGHGISNAFSNISGKVNT